jgi:hypothetical protein
MAVAYRSTGKTIEDLPETLSPERIKELRDPTNRSRTRAIEEIADRNANTRFGDPSTRHQEAVKNFDVQYRDLTANPALLHEVFMARQELVENSARKGEAIDWHSALPEIGERVRKIAGLPTDKERDRFGWLENARAVRGKLED